MKFVWTGGMYVATTGAGGRLTFAATLTPPSREQAASSAELQAAREMPAVPLAKTWRVSMTAVGGATGRRCGVRRRLLVPTLA